MHQHESSSSTSSKNRDESLSLQSELLRKSLHIPALLLPVGMVVLEKIVAVIAIGILALSCIVLEFARAYSSSVNAAVITVLGPVMRTPEEQSTLERVKFSGATYIVISAALLSLFFPPKVGAPLLAMFVVSDGIAAVVGRHYGRYQFSFNKKTVEGFITFSVVGVTVLLIITHYPIPLAVLVALLSSTLESAPIKVNDNLYVPITSSIILYMIINFT